jgi:hypothetical protein
VPRVYKRVGISDIGIIIVRIIIVRIVPVRIEISPAETDRNIKTGFPAPWIIKITAVNIIMIIPVITTRLIIIGLAVFNFVRNFFINLFILVTGFLMNEAESGVTPYQGKTNQHHHG